MLIEDVIREVIRTQERLRSEWTDRAQGYRRKARNTDSPFLKGYYSGCAAGYEALVACADAAIAMHKARLAQIESIVAATNPLFSEGAELHAAAEGATAALAAWDGSGEAPGALLHCMAGGG